MLNITESLSKIYNIELTQEQKFECESNFFGFFKLLYDINQRLQKEKSLPSEINNKGTK
ncbi:MAG TPA: hypothetical protein VLL98_05460 [Rickettsiales bacterium]|nr:hypothetical protein [Rickettsiales bacterium]